METARQQIIMNQTHASEQYRNRVLEVLHNRLWHTTCQTRFRSILKCGAILPNPAIPESGRWKTSRGPEFYPYARTLGAVSLFDFHAFTPEVYSQDFPMSNWHEFVPFRPSWGSSVWIEIDREAVQKSLISGPELVQRWKDEEAERHTIMPIIEAAHVGIISTFSFRQTLFIHNNSIEAICS